MLAHIIENDYLCIEIKRRYNMNKKEKKQLLTNLNELANE